MAAVEASAEPVARAEAVHYNTVRASSSLEAPLARGGCNGQDVTTIGAWGAAQEGQRSVRNAMSRQAACEAGSKRANTSKPLAAALEHSTANA
eukprot:2634360-Prymnesium_polylepis.1